MLRKVERPLGQLSWSPRFFFPVGAYRSMRTSTITFAFIAIARATSQADAVCEPVRRTYTPSNYSLVSFGLNPSNAFAVPSGFEYTSPTPSRKFYKVVYNRTSHALNFTLDALLTATMQVNFTFRTGHSYVPVFQIFLSQSVAVASDMSAADLFVSYTPLTRRAYGYNVGTEDCGGTRATADSMHTCIGSSCPTSLTRLTQLTCGQGQSWDQGNGDASLFVDYILMTTASNFNADGDYDFVMESVSSPCLFQTTYQGYRQDPDSAAPDLAD